MPSRVLPIIAGVWTQVVGAAYLVLALASLPAAHDAHAGMQVLVGSIAAAVVAIACGALVVRGRLVPLALATGLDVGFGVGLPRSDSAVGAILEVAPGIDAHAIVTALALAMFGAAIACVLALPAALRIRAWRAAERAAGAVPARPSKPGDTLPGVGPSNMRTQLVHVGGRRSRRLIVIAGVAAATIGLGIAVVGLATCNDSDDTAATATGSGSGSAAKAHGSGHAGHVALKAPGADTPIDAGEPIAAAPPPPPPPPATVDELDARFHASLAHGSDGEIGALFDPHAFAFGAAANEIAEGRAAVIAALRADFAGSGTLAPTFSQIGAEGDVGWIAEALAGGGRTFAITACASHTGAGWTFAAMQIGVPVPNETAHQAARAGKVAEPDAVPDTHDTSELARAMRHAFASKSGFVAARSARTDAFNFGSAPGERLLGGAAIKKLFARLHARFALPGGVKVGQVGAAGGWGVANVDFTDAGEDGAEVTQTFRVLAVWLREGTTWRIVQTQFSNAKL